MIQEHGYVASYKLQPDILHALTKKLEVKPTVDGMALFWNAQFRKYCSPSRDPHAFCRDFFAQTKSSFRGEVVWVNPLWEQLPKLVQWLRNEPQAACTFVVFAPEWSSEQWHKDLGSLCVRSVFCPAKHGMFIDMFGEGLPKPGYDFRAWLITENSISSTRFRTRNTDAFYSRPVTRGPNRGNYMG